MPVGVNHRKVVSYASSPYGDGYDIPEGHGTHVSGSAAGKAYSDYGDYKRYDGNAPAAKIAFFDLQTYYFSRTDGPEAVNLPSDLRDIYNNLYANGARIISSSWGSIMSTSDPPHAQYDTQCWQLDQWLSTHLDAIVINAAGNYGDPALCIVTGYRSCIVSPAMAQNVVTVGNSLNDGQSFSSITHGKSTPDFNVNNLYYSSSRGSPGSSRIKPDVTGPGKLHAFFTYMSKIIIHMRRNLDT